MKATRRLISLAKLILVAATVNGPALASDVRTKSQLKGEVLKNIEILKTQKELKIEFSEIKVLEQEVKADKLKLETLKELERQTKLMVEGKTGTVCIC